MNTVGIIGDVLLHGVDWPSSDEKLVITPGTPTPVRHFLIAGGSCLAAAAVRIALSHAPPAPTIFEITPKEWSSLTLPVESTTFWKMVSHAWPGEKTTSQRLAIEKTIESKVASIYQSTTIPLPKDLIDELLKEKPVAPDVPEILAITDLGLYVRDVPLFDLNGFREFFKKWKAALPASCQDSGDIASLAEKLAKDLDSPAFVGQSAADPLRVAAGFHRVAWSASFTSGSSVNKREEQIGNAMILRMRRAAYGLTLRCLLDEMARRRQVDDLKAQYGLSPLLILSIDAAAAWSRSERQRATSSTSLSKNQAPSTRHRRQTGVPRVPSKRSRQSGTSAPPSGLREQARHAPQALNSDAECRVSSRVKESPSTRHFPGSKVHRTCNWPSARISGFANFPTFFTSLSASA